MVKYGNSGQAHDHRRQHGRHRPKRQPIMPLIDAVSVFFFVFLHAPSLFLRLFLSMKRKSRTSCQPIALALGHSVFGYRKKSFENLWRSSIYIRRWSWKLRRGEGRWKGFSCVVIFVMKWSSTKNYRSLLDLFGVGAGEEQEKHSRYPKR